MYRKMQVHLKPYTPKKNVKHPELSKVDNNQNIDNKQTVTINHRPKCTIKAPNRLNL